MCYEKYECPLGKTILKQMDLLLSRGVVRPGTDSDREEYVLARMIGEHFGWDGLRILEGSALTLEDANCHRECNQVRGMIANWKHKRQ
jgi:hypothetical protein